MIKPTRGRVVLFTPSAVDIMMAGGEPLAAIIAHVHSESVINLTVFDGFGRVHARPSVTLLKEGEVAAPGSAFAEWMPYQKGQAAKTEQLEAQVAQRIQSASDALANEVDLNQLASVNVANDFGFALFALKQGKRVARSGWNGKGMWLALSCDGTREVPAANFWAPPNREYAEKQPNGTAIVLPSITMKTATGEILMGWLASQTDMLAEDWTIVE